MKESPRAHLPAPRVELRRADVPLPLESVEAWAERYLEYILEQEQILPLQPKTDAA